MNPARPTASPTPLPIAIRATKEGFSNIRTSDEFDDVPDLPDRDTLGDIGLPGDEIDQIFDSQKRRGLRMTERYWDKHNDPTWTAAVK
jgi:hypothetical protein